MQEQLSHFSSWSGTYLSWDYRCELPVGLCFVGWLDCFEFSEIDSSYVTHTGLILCFWDNHCGCPRVFYVDLCTWPQNHRHPLPLPLPPEYGVHRGQKRVSNSLELELPVAMSQHVMLGIEPGYFARTARTLTYWAITPASGLILKAPFCFGLLPRL